MFCPQCKVEYRKGFTRCADCDVDLVHELEMTARDPTANKEFRTVWRGVEQAECVSVCYQLQDLSIPYNVTELSGSRRLRMDVTRRYELAVSTEDYERAKSALGIEDDPPEMLSESEWQKMGEPQGPKDWEQLESSEQQELPGANEFSGPDSLPDTPERRDAYFRYWYSDDATVRIWSGGGDEDISGAIEMALNENLIHCRVDSDGGNNKVVFVMPADEARAREIVREIREGSPQQ